MPDQHETQCLPFLRALSDESRWRIVELLSSATSPLLLGEIADRLHLSVYNASRHVKILNEVGILSVRREGRCKQIGIASGFANNVQSKVLDLGCCQFDFSPGRPRQFPQEKQLHDYATVASIFAMNPTARYIMIGGFLGAGKTTAVSEAARHFASNGKRVGLITNDQGRELVDTRMLRSRGFATEEISGGCFCCKFGSLVDAASRLTQEAAPEVFIAEPVGSCTDLVATVSYPLRRIYGDRFSIAPLSVLVDPIRARRILGLEEGRSFSPKVSYIYRKQLEEADIIAISKRDLIDGAKEAELQAALEREFPAAQVLSISARNGDGLKKWFAILESTDQIARPALEIDYDIYADGEALLGWLNATIQVTATGEADAGPLLDELAREIHSRLSAEEAEIAHLKMTLSPDNALTGEVAAINLVRNDYLPELCQELEEPVTGGQMILNLRAEADPDRLASLVESALASVSSSTCQLQIEHLERFRPGRPVPTHRDVG